MNMKFYSTIYLLSIAFLGFSQEAMTLEKALSIGLENNYGIQIADKYIDIAENNNTWAMAGRTPTIDLQGSFTNNLTKDNNPASFLQGTYYNGSLGATANANYVVYNGGRIRLNKEQLLLAIDQQRLNKATDIHSLFRSIYQQYYEVIFQKEQLQVLNNVLALSKDRLDYENTKRAFGSSNTFNIIQFESALVADSNSIITQIQNVETAKRNLYNTLDIVGSANYTFEEALSINAESIDEDRLKSLMSEENYTIKSLDMIAMLNQLNTGIAKAATKPVISLNGSIGFSENGFKFYANNPQTGEPFDFQLSNRITGGIGATLSYNLYDGGIRKTNLQNAEITEQIDQLNILEAKAALGNQLDILIANYQNQLDVLAMTDRQIELAQQNIEITEERFKSGQVTSLDFRNVQNQYLNAAYSKVGAIYALLVTKSEIDFLVGVFE
jgi:outer membrane protein TolC